MYAADDRRVYIGEKLTAQIVAWVKQMGWRCKFIVIEPDFRVGERYDISHPDYDQGYIHPYDDGAVLVRPGGESGYIFRLEMEWRYYSDGSADNDDECPALALRKDIADELIADILPEPPFDCSDEEFRRHSDLIRAAELGEMSFWRDRRHLIPDAEWFDERDLAGFDRIHHSRAGLQLLRHVLLRGGAR